jgi:hypothetical protein
MNGVAAMADSGAFGAARLCAGIVSTADLLLGAAVGPVLDAHVAAAPGRFRGVRVLGPVYTDYDTLLAGEQPRFAAALREVEARQLSLEVAGATANLAPIARLAAAFPGITFVLNHCGGTPVSARSAARACPLRPPLLLLMGRRPRLTATATIAIVREYDCRALLPSRRWGWRTRGGRGSPQSQRARTWWPKSVVYRWS